MKPRTRRRNHSSAHHATRPRATTPLPLPSASASMSAVTDVRPTRRWPIATALLLAGFAAFIAWRFRHDPTSALAHNGEPPLATSAAPGSPSSTRAITHAPPSASPGTVIPYAELGHDGVATDDPLTAYRRANVYPPTSRPLTAEHVDLLHPNQRHEKMRATEHDDGVEFLLTADRYYVLADETLAITLDVRRDGAPLAVAISEAFVALGDTQRYPLAFAPRDRPSASPFGDAARLGKAEAFDPGLAATFAPSMLPVHRQTTAGIYVDFTYDNKHQRAHVDFQYTPELGIPARFTGTFREAVDNGSLVVHAGVAVERGGHYLIDCNLYDEKDRPIAWTRAKVELAAGKRDVALVFFGKVLVDQNASGPLHIAELRGARFDEGRDPDLEQMPPYTGTFTTRYYRTIAFSDAEYDSPDKQRMLKFLADQKARGVHQGAAAHADGSAPGDEK